MPELVIREAEPTDAARLISVLNQIGKESHFLTMDDRGILMTDDEMTAFIKHQQKASNNLYLLALLDGEIAGVLNIHADYHYRIAHIGDLFIAIQKPFWGQGIGRELMTVALDWAKEVSPLRRLELTVQKRNERAVHLYQTLGFTIDCLKERGARDEQGQFIDVYAMSQLIN